MVTQYLVAIEYGVMVLKKTEKDMIVVFQFPAGKAIGSNPIRFTNKENR